MDQQLATSLQKQPFGGTIGLVEEGDSITVDANKLLIQLNVEDRELARRKKNWEKPKPRYKTGILGKYSRLVSSSSQGATTDQIQFSLMKS